MGLFEKFLPVLMYHQINQPDPSTSLVVSPESFARQMDWLERRRFRFLSLNEVVERKGRIPFFERAVALTFDDGFRDNRENAFSLLLKRRRPAALFVVVDWVGQNGFLDWAEIRELSDAGITIGSHSLSHRWLPDISNASELEREVRDSKKFIEDHIGREVPWFCYPVGGVDQRVADGVQKAGYRAAWAAGAKPSHRKGIDPFLCLRRIKVSPSDSNLFRFAIKSYGLKMLFS